MEPSASFTAQFRTYPTLMREPVFWAWTTCLVCSIGGFYAFMGGAPLVGEGGAFGLTSALLGLGMGGSISGGFMLGNYLTGRYATRLGGRMRLVVLGGRWCATLGPLAGGAALLWSGAMHPLVLFGGGAIFVGGLGNGLTLPGANAGVMSVNPRLAGSASGLSGALTLVGGGATFTSVAAAVSGGGVMGGPVVLLCLMSGISAVGLIAALFVQRMDAHAAAA